MSEILSPELTAILTSIISIVLGIVAAKFKSQRTSAVNAMTTVSKKADQFEHLILKMIRANEDNKVTPEEFNGIVSAIKDLVTLENTKTIDVQLSTDTQLTTDFQPATISVSTSSKTVVPKMGPEDSWYQTNFTRSEKGNILPSGTNLWIRLVGVRSYVSAVLKNEVGKVIQIDQSSQFDEDGDIATTRLETAGLPKGKYILQVQGDRGSSDSEGIKTDEFFIV